MPADAARAGAVSEVVTNSHPHSWRTTWGALLRGPTLVVRWIVVAVAVLAWIVVVPLADVVAGRIRRLRYVLSGRYERELVLDEKDGSETSHVKGNRAASRKIA